jgi:hypothetical protein
MRKDENIPLDGEAGPRSKTVNPYKELAKVAERMSEVIEELRLAKIHTGKVLIILERTPIHVDLSYGVYGKHLMKEVVKVLDRERKTLSIKIEELAEQVGRMETLEDKVL